MSHQAYAVLPEDQLERVLSISLNNSSTSYTASLLSDMI